VAPAPPSKRRRGRPPQGFDVARRGEACYAKPRVQACIARGDALRAAGVAARKQGGGGLATLGKAVSSWATDVALTPAVRAEWAAFMRERIEYGGDATEPVTPDEVGGYLTALLLRGIGSQTLGAHRARLFSYIRLARPPQHGLDDTAMRTIAAMDAPLAKSFPGTIAQMETFGDGHLLRAVSALRPFCDRGYLFALEWRAILLLARAGMLRSVDWRAPAMPASQVTRVRAGEGATAFDTVRIQLAFHKTEQRAFNPRAHAVTLPRDSRFGGQLDFYPALLAYTAAAGIQLGRSATSLFPRYKRTSNAPRGRNPSAYPYASALEDMRFILTKAGLDARRYGLHSPRSSGATLLLTRGVPLHDVARLGLWADTASLRKYDRRENELAAAASARLSGT